MRILIVGDVHWSEYSSILRKQGGVYSQRLENLINTVNWCERQISENGCDRVVYLGDFFDKPTLNDREISALREIRWNDSVRHDFIVGNHESSVSDLRFSSTSLLEGDGFVVHKTPGIEMAGDVQIVWLPYILEDGRKPLSDYCGPSEGHRRVIFSHNDLRGIKYGVIESKIGFGIDEIAKCSDLFINGHLHNGSWVKKDRILNLGNITGQGFNEDAYAFSHRIAILDTDTLHVDFIENPYAFNFTQLTVASERDVKELVLKKDNMVVNFKCAESLVPELKDRIKMLGLAESRITTVKVQTAGEPKASLEAIDGNKKFSDFMLERLGDSPIVRQEIMEVIR